MQIDLTQDEIALITNLLNSPVQISPAQMQGYLTLVQGLAAKLQPTETTDA